MTRFARRWIAAAAQLLAAVYCFLGAIQNGSFAVAGVADREHLHRNAQFWFVLSCMAAAGAVLTVVFAFNSRHRPGTPTTGDRVDPTHRVFVDTDCCTSCGVPWTLAPTVFRDGGNSCIVARQPSGATELRRVLRVFRTQELNCVRYGGRDPRVLRILRRVGCGEACGRLR